MIVNFDNVALLKVIEKAAEELVRKFSLETLARIQLRTPVDTGRARAGWRLENLDTLTTVIVNDVEYIVKLEYGSSQQAPEGMVIITAQEMVDEFQGAEVKI
jgi:hypothetical protein